MAMKGGDRISHHLIRVDYKQRNTWDGGFLAKDAPSEERFSPEGFLETTEIVPFAAFRNWCHYFAEALLITPVLLAVVILAPP